MREASWRLRTSDWLNILSYTWRSYGLSPVWTFMCFFRVPESLNALSHTWHLYGFSPVWTLMCAFRDPDWLNALSHMWHLYGFSPVCILLCFIRAPAAVNRLLQTLHSNGFSPEWIRLCAVNSALLWQHFPHSVHLYLPVCVFQCVNKVCFLLYRLSHSVHKYGLDLSSCGCSVISLLSASVFTSINLPIYA